MKKFRVLVRGQNLLLKSEGERKRFGFYTVRVIEAIDKGEAARCAVESIRKEERLRATVLNNSSDPPIFSVEEIAEIAFVDAPSDHSQGLAFYEDQRTEH